jgi:hypothetical protein
MSKQLFEDGIYTTALICRLDSVGVKNDGSIGWPPFSIIFALQKKNII